MADDASSSEFIGQHPSRLRWTMLGEISPMVTADEAADISYECAPSGG